jgi:hypothetical protein
MEKLELLLTMFLTKKNILSNLKKNCRQIFFAIARFAIVEKNHFRDRKWQTILLT